MKYYIGLFCVLIFACSPKTIKEAQTGDKTDLEVLENEPDTSKVIEIVTEEPDNEKKVELILEFQRTACFGKCPTFIIRGFSDGRLIYHGKANVDKLGYYEAFLSTEAKMAIFQKANEIGFFDLANTYPVSGPELSDLPKTKTFLKEMTKEHKVIDSYDAPLALQEFEKFLDDYLAAMEWIKVNGD